MTSVGIRHCERSAAIHLTQAKQNGFGKLQGYAKTLGFLQDTRLVYNDMAKAGVQAFSSGLTRRASLVRRVWFPAFAGKSTGFQLSLE
jgi:hypothetical protein